MRISLIVAGALFAVAAIAGWALDGVVGHGAADAVSWSVASIAAAAALPRRARSLVVARARRRR